MANPIVQFVDSISTTAALRYDFAQTGPNFRTLALGADAIDFGVATFDGEPEGVGGRYGYRQIQFTQRIMGTRAVALARMSALSKELLRATNYLRFQWDPSASPVFFKTYRAQPGTLSLENAGNADAWDIVVPLEADGFAYGLLQTISTVTVTQAPSGTNPMRYVLPAIKGEAPTPLRIAILPTSTSGGSASSGSAWAIGCIAGSSGMTDTVMDIGTGDGFTAGTGTSAAASSIYSFGGSYRTVSITAGQSLISRLSGTHPTLAPSRYKVMLRYEADGSTSVDQNYLFQWRLFTGATSAPALTGVARSVKVPQNATAYVRSGWIDLGEFNYPIGPAPAEIPAGQAAPAAGVHRFDLLMTTAGTTGTVRIDAVRFIPVGGSTVSQATFLAAKFLYSYQPTYTTGPTLAISGTFDGVTETYWSTAITPTSPTGLMPSSSQLAGGFPVADPNAVQNMVIVMATDYGDAAFVGPGSSNINSLNAQVSLDISYYPRYLHIGDGT